MVAVDDAVRELRFLRKLLVEFGIETDAPTHMGQDNMSTIALINSRHFNARTKHIALRFHHCSDLQTNGTVLIRHLSTEEMTADVLTKSLDSGLHYRHSQVLLGRKLLRWISLPLPATR